MAAKLRHFFEFSKPHLYLQLHYIVVGLEVGDDGGRILWVGDDGGFASRTVF